jgi:ribosome-associated protein
MNTFDLHDHEYIELNKLLKLLKWVGSGGEANMLIENGEVFVNGEVETRKRNKLRAGSIVTLFDQQIQIVRTDREKGEDSSNT